MNTPEPPMTRLEAKVDKIAEAITKLVLIEERQSTQGSRVDKLERRVDVLQEGLDKTDAKLESWINRGIGVWALAVTLWTLYKAIYAP